MMNFIKFVLVLPSIAYAGVSMPPSGADFSAKWVEDICYSPDPYQNCRCNVCALAPEAPRFQLVQPSDPAPLRRRLYVAPPFVLPSRPQVSSTEPPVIAGTPTYVYCRHHDGSIQLDARGNARLCLAQTNYVVADSQLDASSVIECGGEFSMCPPALNRVEVLVGGVLLGPTLFCKYTSQRWLQVQCPQ